MAFVHGKSTKIYCNGRNLTQYLSSIETPMTCDTAETTVFGNDSKTYVAGKTDGSLSAEGFYDDSASAVGEILSEALGKENNLWTWFPNGDAFGNVGYALQSINTNHTVASTIDDAAKISVEAQASGGIDRVISLYAQANRTTSWVGTALDNGAGSVAGGSAYLHVLAASGNIPIKLEHSTNNSTWVDLASFTNVTGQGSQKINFTGTVHRYVRGSATLAGGQSINFSMSIVRK